MNNTRLIIRNTGPSSAIRIAQSMWCNYRVISLPVDYIISSWPDGEFANGREAAGIAEAWSLAQATGAGGLLLLGCDVAADPDDFGAMLRAVSVAPVDLHTGLVKLWPESTGRDDWIWSHRGGTLGYPTATQDGSAPPTYVSLGFLWVPARLLNLAAGIMPGWRHGEADVRLSELALANGIGAHVVPGCQPKHLHFQREHDGTVIRNAENRPAQRPVTAVPLPDDRP